MLRIVSFFILCLLFSSSAWAQLENRTDVGTPLKEVLDLFVTADTSKVNKPPKKTMLLVLPTFGHQPAYGFTFGALSRFAFRQKHENKYSSLTAGGSYSTKKQILTYFQNNTYLKDDRFYLSGDWRYYVFSQSNYGLGTDIIPPDWQTGSFDLTDLEQPMDYNYFKFHQTISFRVMPSVYIGTGIHIDGYSNIHDKNLDIAVDNYTYHYTYSKKHGYSDKNYSVKGISLNLVYDSRDNIINTNNGLFVNINYRFNPNQINDHEGGVLLTEVRYFIPLSKTCRQHVLGFWVYGQFLTNGQLPYLNLPAIGWDQSSRSGKGYTQGLFRGNGLAYAESEYRFPITKNQLFSGTVFANVTSTSDKDRNIKLGSYFQPAVGVGLRIMLDKSTLTNFIINYGLGRDSKTFYFNDGEGF